MARQLAAWEVWPGRKYVVAHQHGPTYSGPMAALTFRDGVAVATFGQPRDVFTSVDIRGAIGLSVVWEHVEGYELRWMDGAWEYALPPAAEAPKPRPAPKRKQPKRKRS